MLTLNRLLSVNEYYVIVLFHLRTNPYWSCRLAVFKLINSGQLGNKSTHEVFSSEKTITHFRKRNCFVLEQTGKASSLVYEHLKCGKSVCQRREWSVLTSSAHWRACVCVCVCVYVQPGQQRPLITDWCIAVWRPRETTASL